jgi:hypothetical protein
VFRFGREARGMVVDRDGRIRVTVGAIRNLALEDSGALLTSTDRGRSFRGRAIPGGIASSRLYPAGRGFFLDTEVLGIVLTSSDGRRVRLRLGAPLDVAGSRSRIVALQRLPRVAWIAGTDGISRTHDFGETWQPLDLAHAEGGTAVMLDGHSLVVATRGRGVERLPLDVGDLTVPALRVRLAAGDRRLVGRVRDRHVRQVSVNWFATRTSDLDFQFGSAKIHADGTFSVHLPRLPGRWHIDLVAHDAAGNSSPHRNLTKR